MRGRPTAPFCLPLALAGLLAAGGCRRHEFPEVTAQVRAGLIGEARENLALFGRGAFEVAAFHPVSEVRRSLDDPFLVPMDLYGIEFEADLLVTGALVVESRTQLRRRVGTPGWGPGDIERQISLGALLGPGSLTPGEKRHVRGTAVFNHGAAWHFRLFDAALDADIGVDDRRRLDGQG